MIKILDTDFNRLGVIKNAIDCSRLEAINGENVLDFNAVLDVKLNGFINQESVFELGDDYFDTAFLKKTANEDNTYTIEVEAEQVSYRLNDPLYNVEYFTEAGTPIYILGKILEGTGFTIGTVEFFTEMVYSAQEAKSRRQLLMEFIAHLGGEARFNKFTIDILEHRGSAEIKPIIKDRNVKVVTKTINKRQVDDEGLPLVSYTCTPIYLGDIYDLGDSVRLIQPDLGINEELRVVRVTTDPYDQMKIVFNFANYTDGLESQLYRTALSTVIKDKLYNGTRIGPEYGFEAVRNDKLARAYFRSDGMEFLKGDGTGDNWDPRLWFDEAGGLNLKGNFTVLGGNAETIEGAQAKADAAAGTGVHSVVEGPIPTNGDFHSGNQGNYVTVRENVHIGKVLVVSDADFTPVFELRKGHSPTGELVASRSIPVEVGENWVYLNFLLEAEQETYTIFCPAFIEGQLYSTDVGVEYPYDSGSFSVIGSTGGASYWYWCYHMHVGGSGVDGDIRNRLMNIEFKIDDSSVISTVMQSTQFTTLMDQKLGINELEPYATIDDLDQVEGSVQNLEELFNTLNFSDFVTATEFQQSHDEFNFKIGQSGGVNLLRNSLGFGGFSFWERINEAAITTSQEDSLAAQGYGSGFEFLLHDTQAKELKQTFPTAPGLHHTFSCKLQKTETGSTNNEISFSLLNEETVLEQLIITSDESANFDLFQVTFVPPTNETTLVVHAQNEAQALITGMMVNLGELPLHWTSHAQEIYNANIQMDVQGIKVSRIVDGLMRGFTRVTPDEFAGYYDTNGDGNFEKVFYLQEDETVSKKFIALEELTMGSIRILNLKLGGNNGWAFVPLVDT